MRISPNWAELHPDLNSSRKSLVNSSLEAQLRKGPGEVRPPTSETSNRRKFRGLLLIILGHKLITVSVCSSLCAKMLVWFYFNLSTIWKDLFHLMS